MIINKCFVSVAILTCLSLCGRIRSADEVDDKCLDKNVYNERFMQDVEVILEAKDSLKLLAQLSSITKNGYDCVFYKERSFLEEVDSSLEDDAQRLHNPNYRLTVIDRAIEYFVLKAFRHCKYEQNLPQLSYALKQKAYDWINDKLEVELLPGENDSEKNMEAAERLLDELAPDDGALAEATRQFLALRRLVSEGNCNLEGFEILLKNSLAMRGLNHRYFNQNLRRINKIYKYYAKKREETCRDQFRKEFHLAVEENPHWSRVLGLASSFYLDTQDYGRLAKSLNQRQDGEDSTLQLMVDYANDLQQNASARSLPEITEMDNNKIRQYVKESFIADGNGSLSGSHLDFKNKVGRDKGAKLFDQYLFTPCKYYMANIGRLVEADEFEAYANDQHIESPAGRLVEDLTYHMVRAGYQACKYVLLNQEYILY